MAIKQRTINMITQVQIAASASAVAIGAWIAPATGKIKSVKGWLGTKTGASTAQLDILKSGTVGGTAAASTTSALSAAMDMTSDAIVTGTLSGTDSSRRFVKGEVLYLKATTGAATTMDDIAVTIEVDY